MTDPLLDLALADGRGATLLVGAASTVLSIGDTTVSSWDLLGRPYALVRDSGTYRRGLDGGLLLKREAAGDAPRTRRRLRAAEGSAIVEAARAEAVAALTVLRRPDADVGLQATGRAGASPRGEGVRRLGLIAGMDTDALARDAARFAEACGPVGILPPDQYLSLVVRVTEGCSWNACAFCSLYRDVRFRFKSPPQLAAHVAALRDYFGPSIALRRSVFLGDANALCLAQERLLPLVETVSRKLPGRPLCSFVDAWSGARRTVAEWRALARLGLERVYVGLETGDPALLAWLGKQGTPEDAAALVSTLQQAGIGAGVIVLLGAGGRRFSAAHVAHTASLLVRMALRASDLLYFSEYVHDPGSRYATLATDHADLGPLDPAGCAAQRRAILERLRAGRAAGGPRVATYDVREFVY